MAAPGSRVFQEEQEDATIKLDTDLSVILKAGDDAMMLIRLKHFWKLFFSWKEAGEEDRRVCTVAMIILL